MQDKPIPYGYCHCGCGQKAPIAKRTTASRGHRKNEPLRFIQRHYGGRPKRQVEPKQCACGCGQLTTIYHGVARSYVHGHNARHQGPRWRVEDRGWTSPCWMWLLHTDKDGYGKAKVDGLDVRAHRHVYETMRGPIPVGLQLDHLCRNTACVNPEHLEPVTLAENVRRARLIRGA